MDVSVNFGAVLLGTLFSSFLSGANTCQTVIYLKLYPEDSKLVKGTVALVWTLDVSHTAFLWYSIWNHFIDDFGNKHGIEVAGIGVLGAVAFTSILTFPVHLFYAYRIFHLSNNRRWIVLPVLIITTARLCFGIASVVLLSISKTIFKFAERGAGIWSVGLISTCLADLVIMILMIILLRRGRLQSLRLTSVIDKLVLYTLEAGSLTAFGAVITAALAFLFPHTLLFLVLYFPIAKLYATSLMTSLNVRHQLRRNDFPRDNGASHFTCSTDPLDSSLAFVQRDDSINSDDRQRV